MKSFRSSWLPAVLGMFVVLGLILSARTAAAQGYKQVNLVSDQPGVAPVTDPNLVNAWGIAITPTERIWVANAGTGVSTIYSTDGTPAPLVVTIPPPAGSTDLAEPTGVAFNSSSDFVVSNGTTSAPSIFLFVTENGTISGWSPIVNTTNAILAVDNSASEAIYKGVALGQNGGSNFLYAANFHAGIVEIYDSQFNLVGTFTDDTLPEGYAPFGIRNIGGQLFVTFALQDEDAEDDVAGPGNGFIDVFNTDGTLDRRFASQGVLNAPWGLVVAPEDFGAQSGALLVGNFGDGRINAFDLATGEFRGALFGRGHKPIEIEGLWGLDFVGAKLFFTAGPDDETHGLFGYIRHGGGGGGHTE